MAGFAILLIVFLLNLTYVANGEGSSRMGSKPGASHAAYLMLKAAEEGDTATVLDLITESGVVINTKNNYGVSAIIFAANNGHLDLLKALVDIGADIEDRTNNYRTPLIWSSLWGHYKIVEYLVDIGANMSAFDIEGMTPLLSAVKNGHVRVVDFLINRGANVTVKNLYNGTALSIAKIRDDEQLVHMLQPFFPDDGPGGISENPYYLMGEIIVREVATLCRVCVEEVTRLHAEAVRSYQLLHSTWASMWESIQREAKVLDERSGGGDTAPDADFFSARGAESGPAGDSSKSECTDIEFREEDSTGAHWQQQQRQQEEL